MAELSGGALEEALESYRGTYDVLLHETILEAIEDSFEEKFWRSFGYPSSPKGSSFSGIFRSKEKAEREYFLFRELFLASVAVTCFVMVDPEDRGEGLTRIASRIIADFVSANDPQQVAKPWGLKTSDEVQEYSEEAFSSYFLPSGEYEEDFIRRMFLNRARGKLDKVPVEWQFAVPMRPTDVLFNVLFLKAKDGPLVGKVSETERWADEVGIPLQYRLYHRTGVQEPNEQQIEDGGNIETLGALKDGMPDGPYEDYWADGQLRRKGIYKDGELDGPYEEYYGNGQLMEKSTYKDGKPDGVTEMYHFHGQLYQKGTYKDGNMCGEWFIEGETVNYAPCPPDLEDGN